MTISDASELVFNWFSKNDTLNVSKDFSALLPECKPIEADDNKASIICALKKLKDEAKIIDCLPAKTKSENLENAIWVLEQPLESFMQSVDISFVTAMNISLIINNFCNITKNESGKADIGNIEEKDINSILQICDLLINRIKTLEEGNKVLTNCGNK